MPKKTFVVSAMLIASLSACKTAETQPGVSVTDRSRSSWCQGDRLLSYTPAEAAGMDDPRNERDTDATVAEIQAHNARLRAACPEG